MPWFHIWYEAYHMKNEQVPFENSYSSPGATVGTLLLPKLIYSNACEKAVSITIH